MQILTVTQFAKYASSMGKVRYEYAFCSQPRFNLQDTLRVDLIFGKLLVFLNPNCICLAGECGNVVFECVKRVIVISENDTDDIKVNIICGNMEDEKVNQCHFILIRKIF